MKNRFNSHPNDTLNAIYFVSWRWISQDTWPRAIPGQGSGWGLVCLQIRWDVDFNFYSSRSLKKIILNILWHFMSINVKIITHYPYFRQFLVKIHMNVYGSVSLTHYSLWSSVKNNKKLVFVCTSIMFILIWYQ